MRVLLVTSWGNRCGIAEYAKYLKAGVEAADPTIEVMPGVEWLDPLALGHRLAWTREEASQTLIHLNHHDGLHSRWTPAHVQSLRDQGYQVLLTYHDTRATLADCPKLAAMAAVASSTIVHEPVEGLNAIYWRQGIPAAAQYPAIYHSTLGQHGGRWGDGFGAGGGPWRHPGEDFKAYPQQPVLGTIGFNFPWKNFTRLAEETAQAGWAIVIIAHDASDEAVEQWRVLNPHSLIIREFVDAPTAINYLAGCDATAFMYECANTGTSGAIRMGIAARKPVIALSGCRQFGDLLMEDPGHAQPYWSTRTGIGWVTDWSAFRWRLNTVPPLPWCPFVSRFAEQESWTQRGKDHALLYRMLIQGPLKEMP